ncbi:MULTISPECIES: hypothetical protein [unclassified Streptomyces]|uniref:hypothetical protein n=1 Tax=unclassified Streptomyces TaxID=2593676 RepID=UPI00081EBE86|nr:MULTISPECIES: hypothetical protein [unclassified Streptomyces]MYR30341.1 hypothetical protein [Streptomyces sp. SID4945]SCF49471.1 hypothetical protein GA0115257_12253 [Streptomyces sp. LcepLS]
MDISIVASVGTAFVTALVTASVASWAALRTSGTTWLAAHANRTFDALVALHETTGLGSRSEAFDARDPSAVTRARLTTRGLPLEGPVDAVITSARAFRSAATALKASRNVPYFQAFDALARNVRHEEEEQCKAEERGENWEYSQTVFGEAHRALTDYYACQDRGEDPGPEKVKKQFEDIESLFPDSFPQAYVELLLIPKSQRQACYEKVEEGKRKRNQAARLLDEDRDHLAKAVSLWSVTHPSQLADALDAAQLTGAGSSGRGSGASSLPALLRLRRPPHRG